MSHDTKEIQNICCNYLDMLIYNHNCQHRNTNDDVFYANPALVKQVCEAGKTLGTLCMKSHRADGRIEWYLDTSIPYKVARCCNNYFICNEDSKGCTQHDESHDMEGLFVPPSITKTPKLRCSCLADVCVILISLYLLTIHESLAKTRVTKEDIEHAFGKEVDHLLASLLNYSTRKGTGRAYEEIDEILQRPGFEYIKTAMNHDRMHDKETYPLFVSRVKQ
jgi:hypothetical protein